MCFFFLEKLPCTRCPLGTTRAIFLLLYMLKVFFAISSRSCFRRRRLSEKRTDERNRCAYILFHTVLAVIIGLEWYGSKKVYWGLPSTLSRWKIIAWEKTNMPIIYVGIVKQIVPQKLCCRVPTKTLRDRTKNFVRTWNTVPAAYPIFKILLCPLIVSGCSVFTWYYDTLQFTDM